MGANRLSLTSELARCTLCAERFAQTATAHDPRPTVWFDPASRPRILLAGQAPGARVHASGRPFTDPSGDRLREWLGVDEETFYDLRRIAIVPMALCFPGYNAKGSDLPPPPVCAKTWRGRIMDAIGEVPLTVVIGGHAMRWHVSRTARVADTVRDWRVLAPRVFALPHPSWRNTAWLRKNPWFEADVVPALQNRVTEVLS